jgi:hypothetical protein
VFIFKVTEGLLQRAPKVTDQCVCVLSVVGAALDPPLWTVVPNSLKALSLTHTHTRR